MERKQKLSLEILKCIRRTEFYRNSLINGLKRKQYFGTLITSLVLILIVLDQFKIIEVKFSDPLLFRIVIIFLSAFNILISIWVFTRKKGWPEINKYKSLTVKELEKKLDELKQNEEDVYDQGVRQIARSLSAIITLIVMLLIILAEQYFKDDFQFNLAIMQDDKLELVGVLIVIFIVEYFIGDLIANPISPRKYMKKQNKFLNLVKFAFYDNLSNSILNPKLCKK